MAVKFVKPCGKYGVGDVAVFNESFENRLIADGFAKKKEEPKPPTNRNPEDPQTRQTTVGPQKRK